MLRILVENTNEACSGEDQLLIKIYYVTNIRKILGTETDVHNPFIDFQEAYDTIWRREIRSEIHNLGFLKKWKNCAEL